MAKRLRQANLFETLAKKCATDEIEPSALLEELPVSGELCDDESDDSAAEEELVQIVLKIDNNHTLKASNFKIFLGACPQTPLGACDYRTSVLMSTPNHFYPHTPIY